MTTQTSLFGGRVDVPIIASKEAVDPVTVRDLANNILHHQDMQSQPLISWQGEKTFASTSGSKHSGRPGVLLSIGQLRLSKTHSDALPKLRVRIAGRRLVFGAGSAPASFQVVVAPSAFSVGDITAAVELCTVSGVTSSTASWLTTAGPSPYASNTYSFYAQGTLVSFPTLIDTGGAPASISFDTVSVTVVGDAAGDTEVFPVLNALHVSEVF